APAGCHGFPVPVPFPAGSLHASSAAGRPHVSGPVAEARPRFCLPPPEMSRAPLPCGAMQSVRSPARDGGVHAELAAFSSGPSPADLRLSAFRMDRIAQVFARASAQNRAAFVAYLCAGDPDFDTSLAACRAVLASGVDLLELGVPFSDPLADGLTNQLAAQRALASGMTCARVFELVRALRSDHPDTPIVFYTYYNLVFAHGVDAYVCAA